MLWLLACRAYVPPAEVPAAIAARDARVDPAAPAGRVVVRAGSAFDPSGREGLAWVSAQVVARRLGARVTVGRELVTLDGVSDLSAITAEVTGAEVAAAAVVPARSCTEQAEDVFFTWSWAGHPYGHPVWGRSSVLPTITAGEVSAFLRSAWVRGAVVVPTGMPADPLPTTLPRNPTPTARPRRSTGTLRVAGAGDCFAVGSASDPGGDAGQLPAFRSAVGDGHAADPLVDGAIVALVDGGAAARARVEGLVAAWGATGASWPSAEPERLLPPPRGPSSGERAAMSWFGGGRAMYVVVSPVGEYESEENVLPYTELTR